MSDGNNGMEMMMEMTMSRTYDDAWDPCEPVWDVSAEAILIMMREVHYSDADYLTWVAERWLAAHGMVSR